MDTSKDYPNDLFSAVKAEYKKNKNWEDDHQVRKRAFRFGELLVEEMPELFVGKNTKKKVFIVSHQIFLKCFLAERLKSDKKMPPGSDCMNTIHFDEAKIAPVFYDKNLSTFHSSHNYMKLHSSKQTRRVQKRVQPL